MCADLCVFCDTKTVKDTNRNATLQKFIEQIEIQHSTSTCFDEPLCWDCYSGVVKAVEWEKQVIEVERDVRSLQRIILKMIRQLSNLQENYLKEMRALEGRIKASEQKRNKKSKFDALRNRVRNVVEELSLWQKPHNHSRQQQPSRNEESIFAQHGNKTPINLTTSEQLPQSPENNVKLEQVSADDAILENIVQTNTIDPLESVSLSFSSTDENPNFPLIPPDPLETPENFHNFTHLPSNQSAHYNNRVHNRKIPSTAQNNRQRLALKCPLCSKIFQHPGSLRRHKMTHSGVKPFQCPDCGKGFIRADVLEIHRRIHTGEEPYSCQFCRMGFKQHNHLKWHLQKHHPNYPG